MNIILIILVFGIIVFFHEFGHFIVAKINKIKVSEFSIGMGPAIFAFGKEGETKYALRLLPLGGYCLMYGEDEETNDPNAFSNKSVFVRMLVIAAGPVFNFILAFLFSIVLINQTGCDPAYLYQVVEGSPAYEAGIEPGDKILEIDGGKIYNYRELTLYMELNGTHNPLKLTLEKPDGQVYTVTVTPRMDADGVYRIGVVGGYVECKGFENNIKFSAYELRYWVKATVTSLKMIVTGGVESEDVMGPVGVGGVMNEVIEEVKEESESTAEAVKYIILNMMNWCILLSVNLGIMNLLPIPALDGGRLLLLIIEGVTRKKIPAEKEAIINIIGFVLVLILMFVVLFNDVKNVFFS